MSEAEFQDALVKIAKAMVKKGLAALDVTIMQDGIEASTVSFRNNQGEIEVVVNKIPTTKDGRPQVTKGINTGAAAASCQGLFAL
jgi:hypothetical protein